MALPEILHRWTADDLSELTLALLQDNPDAIGTLAECNDTDPTEVELHYSRTIRRPKRAAIA